MKQIVAIFLSMVILFVGQKGVANEYYESYCVSECSNLEYALYADYLYWTVTHPDLFISSGGNNFSLAQEYTSGYRVGGAIYYNCLDFNARYTRILPRSNVHNPFADSTNEPENLPYALDLHVVDLVFGYTNFLRCHRAFVRPYLGAKLAWFDENANLFVFGSEAPFFTFGLKTHGYGPTFGVEGSWELFHCCIPISLIAQGDISLLYAKVDPFEQSLNFPDHFYSVIAVTDLYIALAFDLLHSSCIQGNVQVGYEVQSWSPTRGLLKPDQTSSMNLNGLVVRLEGRF